MQIDMGLEGMRGGLPLSSCMGMGIRLSFGVFFFGHLVADCLVAR